MKKEIKKILLTGGGTGGSVTPLLAIADELKKNSDDYEFLWIGTDDGPEKEMVGSAQIDFTIISSGKFRRYFSYKNFIDIFKIIKGFFASLKIIKTFKPDMMLSAGGFVSVPVAFACWFSRVLVIVHQQDLRPGLANKLMANVAKKITVTFEKSLKDYGRKAVWLGNPVRKEFRDNKISFREAKQKLGLRSNKPILLVMGGGTGATAINELVRDTIDDLTKFCQIIHITGQKKAMDFAQISSTNTDYKSFEFLNTEGMLKVFTVADTIVSRCGMNALTEICFFKIPAILIPMPNSHQEDNAKVFNDREATVVLDEKDLTKDNFVEEIKKIISDEELQNTLQESVSEVIKIAKAEDIISKIE